MKNNRILRGTATCLCLAMLLCASLAGIRADAASDGSQITVKEVGSDVLYLYNNRTLTGTAQGSYTRGSRLSVSLNGDGSCSVYDGSGNLAGYCSPVDLVEPGTPLFVQPPYLYSADENGNPLVFDLIDLDLYLSENVSDLYKNPSEDGSEKLVLIQRCLMEDLEKAASNLAAKGIGLWVDGGYRPDDSVPGGMGAYHTGTVLSLVLIQNNSELNLSPNTAAFREAKNILQMNGFYLAEDSSYIFSYDYYDKCYGVILDLTTLPRIAHD